ncbi:MAG: nucleoside phosphorylase [Bacilli bacterium]|nr:nucleoside phosphorylase [Bacilli bacterium]
MIIDSFDISEPILKLEHFYGKKGHILEKCLVLLSDNLFNHLQSHYELKQIGLIGGSSYKIPIYAFEYKGELIGAYLSSMGSVLCAGEICECAHITGATKYVMFGSCGTLDEEATRGKFVIPTEAYRDEGTSYHFMPPSDFVEINNANKVESIFKKLNIPYVKGKVWTTDGFLMETVNKVKKRKEEGCLVVEMELAACQAVANYFKLELYDFLQPGDVLMEGNYDKSLLHAANHDLLKLDIGLKIIEEI